MRSTSITNIFVFVFGQKYDLEDIHICAEKDTLNLFVYYAISYYAMCKM